MTLEEKFSLLLWDYQELERAFEKATGGKWVRKSNTPQRTWVGLTDEEVELYWDWEDFQCGCGPSTLFAMVRDIEARLKERNL